MRCGKSVVLDGGSHRRVVGKRRLDSLCLVARSALTLLAHYFTPLNNLNRVDQNFAKSRLPSNWPRA